MSSYNHKNYTLVAVSKNFYSVVGKGFLRLFKFPSTRVTSAVSKRQNEMGSSGFDRKSVVCTDILHGILRAVFGSLRQFRVKYDLRTVHVLVSVTNCKSCNAACHSGVMHSGKELNIASNVISRWAESLCERHRILTRAFVGKLQLIFKTMKLILKVVSFFLFSIYSPRFMLRGTAVYNFCYNDVERADETHGVNSTDTMRTLNPKEDEKVKLENAVLEKRRMTVTFRLFGGSDLRIEKLYIVFRIFDKNRLC